MAWDSIFMKILLIENVASFYFFGYFLIDKKSKEWFSIIYNKKRKIYLIIKTIFCFYFSFKI